MTSSIEQWLEELGLSKYADLCLLVAISDRGLESAIFPGIREADSEPRVLAWTFYIEKCFDRWMVAADAEPRQECPLSRAKRT